MAHGRNKIQSRENRARVRELLLRDWDPIGINDVCPADEYDTYADKAYVMLMDERASAEEITAYLLHAATERMGLTNNAELIRRSESVAIALVKLRPEFETH
jgi:hypothetical protein